MKMNREGRHTAPNIYVSWHRPVVRKASAGNQQSEGEVNRASFDLAEGSTKSMTRRDSPVVGLTHEFPVEVLEIKRLEKKVDVPLVRPGSDWK